MHRYVLLPHYSLVRPMPAALAMGISIVADIHIFILLLQNVL